MISKPTPKADEPPTPQRADEPQICVQVHSLRLPLKPAPSTPTGGTTTADAAGGGAAGAGKTADGSEMDPPAEFGDFHSVWASVGIAGLAAPSSSDTVRVSELLKVGADAAAADITTPAASAAHAPTAAPTRASAARPTTSDGGGGYRRGRGCIEAAGVLAWGEPVAVDAVALCELFGEGATAFEELRGHLIRGTSAGSPMVDTGPRGVPPSSASRNATGRGRASAAGAPNALAAGGRPRESRESMDGAPAGVTIELMGAGRLGHVSIATLQLPFTELLATTNGGDLIHAPMRLRNARGVVLAEVSISIAITHALTALQSTTPSLLRCGLSPLVDATSGAAIAVGAGEAFLKLRTCHLALAGLMPTSMWVEIDLRRPCGQLLRSRAKPAGGCKIEFEMRELLYVADGSLAQRRLAATLHPSAPAAASLVSFSVYCTATRTASLAKERERLEREKRKRARLASSAAPAEAPSSAGGVESPLAAPEPAGAPAGAATGSPADAPADSPAFPPPIDPAVAARLAEDAIDAAAARADEEEEAEGRRLEEALSDGSGRGRYLLGHATLSLRQLLLEQHEPTTEPLDLRDPAGAVCGMLSVSLLARDAMQRARRAALRGPQSVEMWVGAESLLLSPALRAASGVAGLWVEAHLELRHATPGGGAPSDGAKAVAPVLSVASRRVRMPRGGAASGGLAATLAMQLRGCLSLPAGSAARATLQRAIKRGGADASIAFFLFSIGADSSASSERIALAAARVSLGELLTKASAAGARATALGTHTPTHGVAPMSDSVPVQLSLRDESGELLGTLAADIAGLRALHSLSTHANAAGRAESAASLQKALAGAATRGDPEDLLKYCELGADMRASDAWGQTPLHWAASAPEHDGHAAAVDACLRAGASVHGRNSVGMTPLHWASAWGRLPATRSLLKAGADRDALDVRKATPATMVHRVSAAARCAGVVSAPADASDEELDRADAAAEVDRSSRLAMLSELTKGAY